MLRRVTVLLALSAGRLVVAAAQHNRLVETAGGLFEIRKFNEAEALLRQALSESPSDAPALVLLGRVRATAGGHLDEAMGFYRRALEASPDYAPAHHALAKVFAFQQRWPEAKKSFEASLRIDADNAETWLGLGRVTMAMGDDDAAEQYYHRSMGLDPTNALLHFDLGVLRCKKGLVHAAEEAFLKAAELNPSLDFVVVAQMFTAHNMLDHARDAYQKVLHKDPENPEHLLAYGELCEALGDAEEASNAYDKALSGNPGMAKAHLRKALLLTGTGLTNQGALRACGLNAEEAKRHLRVAIDSPAGRQEKDNDRKRVEVLAAEALAWCEMEEREVVQWHGIVSAAGDQSEEKAQTRCHQAALPHHQDEGEAGGCLARGSMTDIPWVEYAGGFISLQESVVEDGREFAEAFLNRSRPVVIKNFQSGFAPKEAWSWEALSARFGERTVRVSVSEDGRFDGPEPGEIWGLPPGEEVLVRPPSAWMAFSDFVRLLKADGIAETFYLEYLAVHQYLGELLEVMIVENALPPGTDFRHPLPMLPSITEMIPLPEPVKESGLELLLVNLWAGKGGTTAVLHYDDYENLLCQIRGTKEVVLFPPKDLENLYYVGRRKGKLEYQYPGKWRRGELEGPNKVVFSSSVRLENPDFSRHPRLRRCRPYRVLLREGDALYIPAFWHHEASEVRSFPDAEDGNVAVNFWFRNVTSFVDEEREVLGIDDPSRAEL